MARKENSRISKMWADFKGFVKGNPKLFVYFHVILFVSFLYLLSARPIVVALIEARGEHSEYLAEERAKLENEMEKKILEFQLETALRINEDLYAQIRVQEEEIASYERELAQRKSEVDLVLLGFRKFLEITSSSNALTKEFDDIYVKERLINEAVGGGY
jgi:hypothetical protein